MPKFKALQDCTIVGHPGIVREGDELTLTERQAKYPRMKGWVAPVPPPKPRAPAPSAGQGAEGERQTPKRRRGRTARS